MTSFLCDTSENNSATRLTTAPEVACGGGNSREIGLGQTERDRLENVAIDYGESRRVHQHLTSIGLLPFVQDICRAKGKERTVARKKVRVV